MSDLKPSADVDAILQNYQMLVALNALTLGEALVKAWELGHIEGQIAAWETTKARLEQLNKETKA